MGIQSIGIKKTRNIGFAAHVDAGKTTLTERVLYYTGKEHAIGSVDDGSATMDWMPLEREHGITITSASTTCFWNLNPKSRYKINIIDTPGHIDFTAEVECALSVLDMAVLLLDGSAGVQAQTYTVNRQMNRYTLPRVVFVNKCDKPGVDIHHVMSQARNDLGLEARLLNFPVYSSNKLAGIVDLLNMDMMNFEGENGEKIIRTEIPMQFRDDAMLYKELLIESLSEATRSEQLLDAYVGGSMTTNMLNDTIRDAVINCGFVPIFTGSALKNIGVQPVLDAISLYGPSPLEVIKTAQANGDEVMLEPNSDKPTVAFCYKLEYGDRPLSHFRVFQGAVKEGDRLVDRTKNSKLTISKGQMSNMHADKREPVSVVSAGNFFAISTEVDVGSTFSLDGNYKLLDYDFPDPVISQALIPADHIIHDKLLDALSRYTKQNPTLRFFIDDETDQIILEGMGELHLNIIVAQLKEKRLNVTAEKPKVAYRERPTITAAFDYKHRKQTGGHGQYGHVIGTMGPGDERYIFGNMIREGTIPTQYISSVDKGFQSCLDKGYLIGAPVTGVKVVLTDGSSHNTDSSEIAFKIAAQRAFRQAYMDTRPEITEPMMSLSVECVEQDLGGIMGSISKREGKILDYSTEKSQAVVKATVPLRTMFGYATHLRSITGGFANFTMEPCGYLAVPRVVSNGLIAEFLNK